MNMQALRIMDTVANAAKEKKNSSLQKVQRLVWKFVQKQIWYIYILHVLFKIRAKTSIPHYQS